METLPQKLEFDQSESNWIFLNLEDIKKTKSIFTRFFENELSSISIINKIINKFKIFTKILNKFFKPNNEVIGINTISNKKHLKNIRFKKISDYITSELSQDADLLTVEIYNTLKEIPLIKDKFIFDDLNFFEVNRLEYVQSFFHIALKLLSIKQIIEIENPEKIFISANVDITNYVIITTLLSHYNLKVEFLSSNLSKRKSIVKSYIPYIQILIERLWNWNLWKIFDKKLIGLKRFKNYKKKILYLGHYKNIFPTLIQLILQLQELEDNSNIVYVPHKLKNAFSTIIQKESLKNTEILLYSDRSYRSFKGRYNKYRRFLFEIVKSDAFKDIKLNSIGATKLIKISLLNMLEKIVNSFKYLENLTYIIKKIKPGIVVMLSGNDAVDELAVRIAKREHIPTLYVPHSIMGLTHERTFLQHDYIGCAGKQKEELFLSWGMDSKTLKLIGIPLYDKLYQKLSSIQDVDKIRSKIIKNFKLNHANKIILLLTSHQEDYLRKLVFTSVVNAVKNNLNIDLIVKIHPIEEKVFYQDLKKESGINKLDIVKNIDLHELIMASDLVIGSNTGAQIEAILLDKDVINLSFKTLLDPHLMVKYGAVIDVLNPEDLGDTIHKILYDENIKNDLYNGRKNYIESVLFKFDGKASKRVKELIENILSNEF